MAAVTGGLSVQFAVSKHCHFISQIYLNNSWHYAKTHNNRWDHIYETVNCSWYIDGWPEVICDHFQQLVCHCRSTCRVTPDHHHRGRRRRRGSCRRRRHCIDCRLSSTPPSKCSAGTAVTRYTCPADTYSDNRLRTGSLCKNHSLLHFFISFFINFLSLMVKLQCIRQKNGNYLNEGDNKCFKIRQSY